MTRRITWCATVAVLLWLPAAAVAQSPQQLAGDATRYMAMGDSIAAGFKAQPMTQGYAFLLYQRGVFDRMPHTLFNDIAAVGATSQDVLDYQVPQALIPAARGGFQPQYITLTVGGNDLANILLCLAQGTPQDTCVTLALAAYDLHMSQLLAALTTGLPNAKIFVGNLYSVPEIQASFPGGEAVLAAFNEITRTRVESLEGVYLVDVYSAFLGRTGLLLIERRGADSLEVHLTNAGHAAMANAFAEVIEANK
jgi:lysophospholipase L1-like esterase